MTGFYQFANTTAFLDLQKMALEQRIRREIDEEGCSPVFASILYG